MCQTKRGSNFDNPKIKYSVNGDEKRSSGVHLFEFKNLVDFSHVHMSLGFYFVLTLTIIILVWWCRTRCRSRRRERVRHEHIEIEDYRPRFETPTHQGIMSKYEQRRLEQQMFLRELNANVLRHQHQYYQPELQHQPTEQRNSESENETTSTSSHNVRMKDQSSETYQVP